MRTGTDAADHPSCTSNYCKGEEKETRKGGCSRRDQKVVDKSKKTSRKKKEEEESHEDDMVDTVERNFKKINTTL